MSVPRLGGRPWEKCCRPSDVPYVCIDANGRLGSSTSKHVGSLNADQETPNGERLRHFLVGANLCAVNTVICEGDGPADKGETTWVRDEFDVAMVRDDQYAVVVDLETMWCVPRGWQQASQGEALRPEDAKPDVQRSLSTRSGENSVGNS